MKALVLARGLGTRMQREDPGAQLDAAQRRAADAGMKALMPIAGRPFLDYLLSALADAGIADVGLVVGPEHAVLAGYFGATPPSRVHLTFIVQAEPLGTANAVVAAAAWVAAAPFLAMNADNLYPVPALRDMASLDEPGLAAFDADDLVRTSNIAETRIRAFAEVDVDDAGYLAGIVEKPAAAVASERRTLISMNLWRFDARIFPACRDVPRSARGEYELPEAVGLAVRRGGRFRAIRCRGPVLDLSSRADALDVERRLGGMTPRP